jgi:CRISPR system Cascade subunit CasC
MRIEIHVLQNFAPSNLNRDDTGSPKDADFGGHRRARISSQCQKRAMRNYFKDHDLIPAANRGERTKRLAEAVAKILMARGRAEGPALRAGRNAVSAFLPKSEDKDEHKTPYLLFLGESEIARFADVVNEHWDAFSVEQTVEPKPAAAAEHAGRRTRSRQKPAEDGPKPPEGFDKAVEKLLDGGKAADLALFGRMLADLPEKNVDAACQVAHAISTNKIHSMEMDYYTAVDDLKPEDTAGADMIGTIEFNSACYYKYATLDVGELLGGYRDEKKTRPFGLQGDRELARTTAFAFLKAFIDAIPTGKQNSFAAHSKPSLVFAVVRDGPPVSLANAFVKPITPGRDESLVEKSILALDGYYGRLIGMHGDGGLKKSAVCQMDDVKLTHLKDDVGSVDRLIETVITAAFLAGGDA